LDLDKKLASSHVGDELSCGSMLIQSARILTVFNEILLFVPYVFFLSIFMFLFLADRKRRRKRERERARSKEESYDNKIGRSNAKKGSVKLLF
jgi:hypothetical protein